MNKREVIKIAEEESFICIAEHFNRVKDAIYSQFRSNFHANIVSQCAREDCNALKELAEKKERREKDLSISELATICETTEGLPLHTMLHHQDRTAILKIIIEEAIDNILGCILNMNNRQESRLFGPCAKALRKKHIGNTSFK